MGLFTIDQISKINAVADKSPEKNKVSSSSKDTSASTLEQISREVREYFRDSKAILITTQEQLHDYVSECIKVGYAGIDTETTGLDRVHDHIVGSSLYYPGGVECYIPNKHLVPVFDTLRPNQLTYEQCYEEFQRLVDAKCKMIFANADFDIAMLYKDYKVDFSDVCYYDVILAWRCIKGDELDNRLKVLHGKYVLGYTEEQIKDPAHAKSFSDFFTPKNFPYSSPDVAKLYAANDAKITYELFLWQFPLINKNDPKCKENHLEQIADLVWGIEFPMIKVCALLHRQGIYFDTNSSKRIGIRYNDEYNRQLNKMRDMVQNLIDTRDFANNRNRPFRTGKDFNPDSVRHTQYLLYTLLKLPIPQSGKNKGKMATGKEVIQELNLPEINQLLLVRSLSTVIGTFTDKLPKSANVDHKVHSTFKTYGAATGRMCIAKGTPITVLNGVKNIEDIKPGDYVYCYDMNGDIQLSHVKNLWKTGEDRECVDIKWQSSGSGDIGHLICTPEHRILKKDRFWCQAKDLKKFDKLVHYRKYQDDSNYEVQSVTPAGKFDVYDIEVEGHHNFIASEICVHNSSESPNIQNIPSHLTDIRHSFRADPSVDDVLDCNYNESSEEVSIELLRNSRVYLEDGSLKFVKDLIVEDKIKLVEDNKPVILSIFSIENNDPEYVLKFKVSE